MIAKKNRSSGKKKYQLQIKTILDRVIATITLVFMAPVMIIVAIAVYFRMGSPILFTQLRSGKEARIFQVYKFRSMTNACDEWGNLLPDEDRLTSFGKFLRRVKLDETLQMWNILKGEMSFVGPRPTLPEQVKDYDELQKRRLFIRPGLTGWAQVNGNTELTWDERIWLDIWYLNHWSLWLDLTIIVKTLTVVIWGERRNEKALNQALSYAKNTLKVDLNKVDLDVDLSKTVAESLR